MAIEKKYEEMSKKYDLPEFSEIDGEFEISDVDDSNFILRGIIRKMTDRADYFASILEEILHPDMGGIHSMHETRFFGDIEKKQMFDLYKALMHLNRSAMETSLLASEREEANFIKSFYSEWKTIKIQLLGYVRQLKSSWRIDTDIKEELGLGYLG